MTVHRYVPNEPARRYEPAGWFVNRCGLAANLNGPHPPPVRRHHALSDHVAAAIAVTDINVKAAASAAQKLFISLLPGYGLRRLMASLARPGKAPQGYALVSALLFIDGRRAVR